jgi:hypothetical protein
MAADGVFSFRLCILAAICSGKANPDGERRHELARLNARCAHQADLCRLLDHIRSHRRHSIPAPQ